LPSIHASGTHRTRLLLGAWRIACSIKTTTVLLAALTVLTLLGTVFPQLTAEIQAGEEAYGQWLLALEARYGGLAPVLRSLGLFTIYTSPLTLLLLAALLTSGIVCTLDRIRPVWRSITASPSPVRPHSFYTRTTCRYSTEVASRNQARQATEAILSRCRYRVTSEEQDGAMYIAGHRNRWSRIGSIITHVALMLLAVGALWSAHSAWSEPAVVLGPGQTYDVGHGHGFQVRHDGFEMERYPDGTVKEYLSHLVVLRQGAEVVRKTIKVNDPLVYEGVAFHLYASGPSVLVRGWNTDGQPLAMEDATNGQISTGELATNFASLDQEQSVYIPSLETTLYLTLVEPSAPKSSADAALVSLEAVPKGATGPSISTTVSSGETVVLSGVSLQFSEDYHSVLRVVSDPGFQPVIGASLVGLAGLAITFYFNPSRVWVKLTDSELLLAGSSHRNRVAFEQHFARIVAELHSELR
jgi:cytochrome c biogenesis protein